MAGHSFLMTCMTVSLLERCRRGLWVLVKCLVPSFCFCLFCSPRRGPPHYERTALSSMAAVDSWLRVRERASACLLLRGLPPSIRTIRLGTVRDEGAECAPSSASYGVRMRGPLKSWASRTPPQYSARGLLAGRGFASLKCSR